MKMQIVAGIIIGWIHLMAVVIWIGGAFFLNRILAPIVKELEPPQAGKLNQGIVKRFSPLAWISIIVIVITGLLRAAGRGTLNLDSLFNTTYGNILLGKIGLVVVMVIIGIMITVTGLRMMKLAIASPPPAKEIGSLQGRIKILSETNLILGIIAIFLAVSLRFISP